jgi:glucose/arabinose dehydrogenase
MRARAPSPGAVAALVALSLAGCGDGGAAGGEPSGPRLERLGSFAEPVHLADAPGGGGALFVAERAGRIRQLGAEGDVVKAPFLDISEDVLTEGEGGLLSLAFDPDYARTGLLYVYYAHRAGRIVVDEYRAEPGAARVEPETRRELVSIPHPNFIHWGGLLSFGPDGALYAATGDGGPPYPIPDTAQDPESLLGKILRIDRSNGGAEVVALGLRNPWRFSFDRRADEVWIGDVGDFNQEEIDRIPFDRLEDANFGWPDLEGTAQTTSDLKAPDSVPPLVTYKRTGKPDDPACAVTGGHVVRDRSLSGLVGRYLYADFCEGEIIGLDASARRPRPRDSTEPRT